MEENILELLQEVSDLRGSSVPFLSTPRYTVSLASHTAAAAAAHVLGWTENGFSRVSLTACELLTILHGYLEVAGVAEIPIFSSAVQNLWWKEGTIWGSRCGK